MLISCLLPVLLLRSLRAHAPVLVIIRRCDFVISFRPYLSSWKTGRRRNRYCGNDRHWSEKENKRKRMKWKQREKQKDRAERERERRRKHGDEDQKTGKDGNRIFGHSTRRNHWPARWEECSKRRRLQFRRAVERIPPPMACFHSPCPSTERARRSPRPSLQRWAHENEEPTMQERGMKEPCRAKGKQGCLFFAMSWDKAHQKPGSIIPSFLPSFLPQSINQSITTHHFVPVFFTGSLTANLQHVNVLWGMQKNDLDSIGKENQLIIRVLTERSWTRKWKQSMRETGNERER